MPLFTVFTDASSATDTAGISKHRRSPYIATIVMSQNYTCADQGCIWLGGQGGLTPRKR